MRPNTYRRRCPSMQSRATPRQKRRAKVQASPKLGPCGPVDVLPPAEIRTAVGRTLPVCEWKEPRAWPGSNIPASLVPFRAQWPARRMAILERCQGRPVQDDVLGKLPKKTRDHPASCPVTSSLVAAALRADSGEHTVVRTRFELRRSCWPKQVGLGQMLAKSGLVWANIGKQRPMSGRGWSNLKIKKKTNV